MHNFECWCNMWKIKVDQGSATLSVVIWVGSDGHPQSRFVGPCSCIAYPLLQTDYQGTPCIL